MRRTANRPLAALLSRTRQALGLLAASCLAVPAGASGLAAARPGEEQVPATASAQTRQVVEWIMASRDNHGLPFIVVDKADARLVLFDGSGTILAQSPVLLGLARGDVSPAGIGDRKLSLIKPAERITPAGRFVASAGYNLAGQDILWVDYGAAISLHRATDRKPGLTAKSRLDRLATASASDNRVTHGCINVAPDFYDRFIRTTFSRTDGIVYVLPETSSAQAVFQIHPPQGQAAGSAVSGAGTLG